MFTIFIVQILLIVGHGFFHHLFGNSVSPLAMPIPVIRVLKDLSAHMAAGLNLGHMLQLVVSGSSLLVVEPTATYQANVLAVANRDWRNGI